MYENPTEKFELKKPIQLTLDMQIYLALSNIRQLYGNDFLYYNELKDKSYIVQIDNSNVIINIVKSSKPDVKNKAAKSNIIDKFTLVSIKERNGVEALIVKAVDLKRLTNNFINSRDEKLTSTNAEFPIIKNNIIWDREILRYNEQYTLGKIFNRVIALDKTVNQYELGSVVFYDIDDGIIVPYSEGTKSKIVISDGGWSSIVYGETWNSRIRNIYTYGRWGNGQGRFRANNGIAYGREISNESYTTFPCYIADVGNNRIVRIDYLVNNSNGFANFIDSTFSTVNTDLHYPYDVSYFKSFNEINDKLWISEIATPNPSLVCVSLNTDNVAQRIRGYRYNGVNYILQEFSKPKLCVYDIGFYALVFTDYKRNNVVCCQLDSNGLGNLYSLGQDEYLIESQEPLHFPDAYRINSVNIHKTSLQTVQYPYLWVTTGYQPGYESESMLHGYAMNSNANWAYLGSTSIPRNTSYYFHDLTNTILNNDYYDIFTTELWNDSYGMRKYFPFVDVREHHLSAYCADSTNKLIWEAIFTNDCWIKVWAERQISENNWQPAAIKEIDGNILPEETYEYVIWRLKGERAFTGEDPIDISLNLPFKDYVLGGKVRLHAKLYPEYFDPNNLNQYSDFISLDYEVDIQKTCLPKQGGCPFLYVKDENSEYIPDNNVLHRMEFSDASTNITDKYKLRITPLINHDQIELYLVENENDFAFIDQVKVYAVDHHYSKKMGVTEDNKIVVYDSLYVNPSDSVMLNTVNITSNVNYFTPSSTLTNGYKNDSLYAHFSYIDSGKKKFNIQNSDSKNSVQTEKRAVSKENYKAGPDINLPIAFITNLRNLQYPVSGIKDTAGLLTATSIYSNTTSKIFARRELESEVILPLFNDTDLVDHLTIDWQSDFRMKYLGIATLNYSNYTMTEMPIVSGNYITLTQDSSITSALTDIDANYGEVNASAFLKMTFDASQLPGITEDGVREYVIEVTGHYTNGDDNSLSKIKQNIPLVYNLSQNYPNPFNPTTKINYELPLNTKVNIVIYDILGREVMRLVNNEFKQAGRYTVEFNGQNYASGVYFYRIEAGNFIQSKKMVLVK